MGRNVVHPVRVMINIQLVKISFCFYIERRKRERETPHEGKIFGKQRSIDRHEAHDYPGSRRAKSARESPRVCERSKLAESRATTARGVDPRGGAAGRVSRCGVRLGRKLARRTRVTVVGRE